MYLLWLIFYAIYRSSLVKKNAPAATTPRGLLVGNQLKLKTMKPDILTNETKKDFKRIIIIMS